VFESNWKPRLGSFWLPVSADVDPKLVIILS